MEIFGENGSTKPKKTILGGSIIIKNNDVFWSLIKNRLKTTKKEKSSLMDEIRLPARFDAAKRIMSPPVIQL